MATINNTASATYGYGRAGQDTAVSNTASTNLIEEYAISGSKISNNYDFRNGENLTYQIVVSNDGVSPLYNVTVADNLGGTTNPLTYLENSATVSINGTITPITPTTVRPLTFVLTTPLLSGERAIITYIARVSTTLSADVMAIANTASIAANEGSATGQIITVSPDPSFFVTRADYADVSISKAVSDSEIVSGQTFSYVITLSNSGNLEASGVVITDTLPENFTISSITSETGGVTTTYEPTDWTVEPSTNTLTLPTGGDKQINVPAASGGSSGTTTITIYGSISN